MQKYEKGSNRVSSSRPADLANALDVALPYFFDEMAAGVSEQTPSRFMNATKLPTVDQDKDPMARRETVELVRAYFQITDPVCGRAWRN